jgi:hypothetical protein
MTLTKDSEKHEAYTMSLIERLEMADYGLHIL